MAEEAGKTQIGIDVVLQALMKGWPETRFIAKPLRQALEEISEGIKKASDEQGVLTETFASSFRYVGKEFQVVAKVIEGSLAKVTLQEQRGEGVVKERIKREIDVAKAVQEAAKIEEEAQSEYVRINARRIQLVARREEAEKRALQEVAKQEEKSQAEYVRQNLEKIQLIKKREEVEKRALLEKASADLRRAKVYIKGEEDRKKYADWWSRALDQKEKQETNLEKKRIQADYRQRLEWDRVATSFRRLSQIGIAAFGVLIRESIRFGVELARITSVTGESIGKMAKLSAVAEGFGIPAQTFIKSIGGLSQALLTAGEGTSLVAARVREVLEKSGLQAERFKGQHKPILSVLAQVRTAYQELESPIDRAYLAQRLFGENAEGMMPFLNASDETLRDLTKTMEAMPEVTTENVQAMIRFNVGLKAIQLGIRTIGMQITTGLLPLFDRFKNALISVSYFFKGLGETGVQTFSDISAKATIVATLLGTVLIPSFTMLGRILSGLSEKMTLFGATSAGVKGVFSAIFSTAGLITIAIAGIIAGVVALWARHKKIQGQVVDWQIRLKDIEESYKKIDLTKLTEEERKLLELEKQRTSEIYKAIEGAQKQASTAEARWERNLRIQSAILKLTGLQLLYEKTWGQLVDERNKARDWEKTQREFLLRTQGKLLEMTEAEFQSYKQVATAYAENLEKGKKEAFLKELSNVELVRSIHLLEEQTKNFDEFVQLQRESWEEEDTSYRERIAFWEKISNLKEGDLIQGTKLSITVADQKKAEEELAKLQVERAKNFRKFEDSLENQKLDTYELEGLNAEISKLEEKRVENLKKLKETAKDELVLAEKKSEIESDYLEEIGEKYWEARRKNLLDAEEFAITEHRRKYGLDEKYFAKRSKLQEKQRLIEEADADKRYDDALKSLAYQNWQEVLSEEQLTARLDVIWQDYQEDKRKSSQETANFEYDLQKERLQQELEAIKVRISNYEKIENKGNKITKELIALHKRAKDIEIAISEHNSDEQIRIAKETRDKIMEILQGQFSMTEEEVKRSLDMRVEIRRRALERERKLGYATLTDEQIRVEEALKLQKDVMEGFLLKLDQAYGERKRLMAIAGKDSEKWAKEQSESILATELAIEKAFMSLLDEIVLISKEAGKSPQEAVKSLLAELDKIYPNMDKIVADLEKRGVRLPISLADVDAFRKQVEETEELKPELKVEFPVDQSKELADNLKAIGNEVAGTIDTAAKRLEELMDEVKKQFPKGIGGAIPSAQYGGFITRSGVKPLNFIPSAQRGALVLAHPNEVIAPLEKIPAIAQGMGVNDVRTLNMRVETQFDKMELFREFRRFMQVGEYQKKGLKAFS